MPSVYHSASALQIGANECMEKEYAWMKPLCRLCGFLPDFCPSSRPSGLALRCLQWELNDRIVQLWMDWMDQISIKEQVILCGGAVPPVWWKKYSWDIESGSSLGPDGMYCHFIVLWHRNIRWVQHCWQEKQISLLIPLTLRHLNGTVLLDTVTFMSSQCGHKRDWNLNGVGRPTFICLTVFRVQVFSLTVGEEISRS